MEAHSQMAQTWNKTRSPHGCCNHFIVHKKCGGKRFKAGTQPRQNRVGESCFVRVSHSFSPLDREPRLQKPRYHFTMLHHQLKKDFFAQTGFTDPLANQLESKSGVFLHTQSFVYEQFCWSESGQKKESCLSEGGIYRKRNQTTQHSERI